jgi:hypothetical protein
MHVFCHLSNSEAVRSTIEEGGEPVAIPRCFGP